MPLGTLDNEGDLKRWLEQELARPGVVRMPSVQGLPDALAEVARGVGSVTLVAGAATVSTDSVTADSLIFLTSQTDGGTPGFLRVTARTPGTDFTITSSNAADTSTVAWLMVEG